MIKKVHHIGIAVKDLKESVALFEKLLGVKAHITEVPCQRVTEAVLKIDDGAEIDLLEAMDQHSAVSKFLENRGEGLHHIALEVDDVNAELKAMEEKGVRLIDKEGREGTAGQIGFLHPKSVNGVLVELVQVREGGRALTDES